MNLSLELPAPSRKELLFMGGAAALALGGIIEGPAALVLAAVPLVRSGLTRRDNGNMHAAVAVDRNGVGPRRARGNTRRSASAEQPRARRAAGGGATAGRGSRARRTTTTA